MSDLRYPIGKFQNPTQIDQQQLDEWIEQISTLPRRFATEVVEMGHEQLDKPYREGGWTIRDLIHHLADSHINSYVRFHWAMTEESPKIKAYDENGWAELPYLKDLSIQTSLDLLSLIHERWVALLNSMTTEAFDKKYIHPLNGEQVLKEVLAMYAWHGEHHLAHVTELKKRMGWT